MRHNDLPGLRSLWIVLVLLGWLGSYAQTAEPETPLFSFGLIADIQYADKPTVGKRHYSESLQLLNQCVQDLSQRKLAFTVQLGDIVDGNRTPERTRADLDRVLQALQPIAGTLHHVLGNHCMNAGREYLLKKYELAQSYYDFTPPGIEGWRMVVLDGNDAGYGVISPSQLAWLRQILAKAETRGEKVLLFCHYALAPEAAAHHRLNQPRPLNDILARSHGVVAYLAGHEHDGGYAEKDGIYHMTLQGMIEAPAQNAYAIVHVYQNRLELEGIGAVPTRKMPFHTGVQKQSSVK